MGSFRFVAKKEEEKEHKKRHMSPFKETNSILFAHTSLYFTEKCRFFSHTSVQLHIVNYSLCGYSHIFHQASNKLLLRTDCLHSLFWFILCRNEIIMTSSYVNFKIWTFSFRIIFVCQVTCKYDKITLRCAHVQPQEPTVDTRAAYKSRRMIERHKKLDNRKRGIAWQMQPQTSTFLSKLFP